MTKKIVYTMVDEAPALATKSLLPIIKAFTNQVGIEIETRDISLAGRIIAAFPEELTDEQKKNDDLAYLGELTQDPKANIIKLPNISASIPQLKAAIKELQEQGYKIPDFPEEPQNEEEKKIKERFSNILGSAVNPVLREGNSDRRAPRAVKNYAKKHPYKIKEWEKTSKTHVATMKEGNFKTNEKSLTMDKDALLNINFYDKEGNMTVLKEKKRVEKGEIVDATFMSKKKLKKFIREQIADAKKDDILFSLHMKATMMKVSDPIIFGYAVEEFFCDTIKKHKDTLKELHVNFANGLGDLYTKIEKLPQDKKDEIVADIEEEYTKRADVAMVNSSKGITNFHVPSDIIIDASMPAMIRGGGKMWNKEGKEQDTKAVIPDSSYASLYRETIEDCKRNGAFDPSKMGTVQNVGLMAKKAEEYGSHPTTFIIPKDGVVKVVDEVGHVLHETEVEEGDVWRMVMVKDAPIRNWVKLAVERAREMNVPAVFWLDNKRAHDIEVIKKVEEYLKEYDTTGLELPIMRITDATKFSLERMRKGLDTISVTGNVLRDYNTDLFPILELGTSAKMLSIVPLMSGGKLFETGAGGSAPKHVQQLLEENHLRWDSLGEFLAITSSLEYLANREKDKSIGLMAQTLDKAVERLLDKEKSPQRTCKQIDNRGSHFYLAFYWAEALAKQNDDPKLKKIFRIVKEKLRMNEERILRELNEVQGKKVDIKGYYKFNEEEISKVMRPSKTFNIIIENF